MANHTRIKSCTKKISEWLKLSDDNHLSAIETLCKHVMDLHYKGHLENETAVEHRFHQFCCKTNSTELPGYCDWYLEGYGLNLNCSVPTRIQPNIGNYDLNRYDTISYLLMTLLTPMGLIGNLLILYAIFKLKCLPRQTGYFLSSLALGDLGTIFLFLASFLCLKIPRLSMSDEAHKFLFPSLDVLCASISLLQITVISIERAVAVTWPLKYPSYISAKRAKLTVIVLWVISILLFCYSLSRIVFPSQLYVEVHYFFIISILLFAPILIIVTAYTFVLVCAYQNLSQDRQRIKMLTLLLRSTRNSTGNDSNSNSNNNNNDNNDKNNSTDGDNANHKSKKKTNWQFSKTRCREIKLAINVAMIVLPFLGCWGFFLSASLYEVLTDNHVSEDANWLIFVAPFIVSNLNPILYLIFTRSLRKAVKSLIKKNMKSKLSRTELSFVNLSTNSRRPSSVLGVISNRRIGRDSTGGLLPKHEDALRASFESGCDE